MERTLEQDAQRRVVEYDVLHQALIMVARGKSSTPRPPLGMAHGRASNAR